MKKVILILILLLVTTSHKLSFSQEYWEKYHSTGLRKIEVSFTIYIMEPSVYVEARNFYWDTDSEHVKAFVVHYNNGKSVIFMPLENIKKEKEMGRMAIFYYTNQYIDICRFGHEVIHVIDNGQLLEGRAKIFDLP